MQKSGEIRPITQSFSLPPELGVLEPGSSANPAVFIIQDAHGHYEAQKNTQKILEFLDKRGLSSVLVEGGAGPLKKEKIHFFRQEAFNSKAADVLAHEAQIGGAELFLLTARPELKAEGLENEELYLQNLKSYQDVWALKAQTGEWLEKDLTAIRDEASKVFSKELLEFFKSWVLFEEGVSDFPVFLASLQKNALKTLNLDLEDPRSQQEWPMLVRYAELKKREPRLDETSAREELKKLTAWARKAGLERGMLDFLEAEDSGKEAVGLRAFWENFYEQAGPKGFRFSDYPALSLLEGFKILGAEIQFPDLMAETEKLQRLVLERSVREPAQKKLIEKFHGHLLVKKLLSLSMTREEVKALEARESARPRDPAILESFEKALRFYRIAAARDAFMARKALSLGASPVSPAAVIAGGFHTQSLKKMLEDRGLTCAVVTPHMTSLGGQDAYTRAMTGEEAVVDFGASSVRVASWVSDWKQPLPGSVPAQRKKLLDVIKKWGVGQGADWESLKPAPRSEIRNLPNVGDKIEMSGESYSIASILGEGATGRVYLAQPVRESGRPAAVKYVRHETGDRDLEKRKAQHEFLTQKRAGENPGGIAAEAYGWDSAKDYSRIMMEYLPGGLLYGWHFRKSDSSKLEVLKKFIAAVAEIHKRGIVHMDLKTSSVQVLGDESIRILDFGFSQIDGVLAPLGDPENIAGTLDYMAPEIISQLGPYAPATDVFSLGVSLFEVMSGGQQLFPDSSLHDVVDRNLRLAAILRDLDSRLPNFWKPFAPLLRRALDPVPAERFQDGQAVLDEFLKIASGLSSVAALRPPDSSRSEVRTSVISQLSLLDYREASQGWKKIFGNDHPVSVELGIGDGRQLYDLALANPDQNFVGVELPTRTENEKRATDYKKFAGRPNVRLIFTEAEKALSVFQPGSVRQFLILYPPPRREAMEGESENVPGKIPELLSVRMPLMMARVLEDGGQVRILTEREEYSRILEKRFSAEPGFKVKRVKLFPGEDPSAKMGFDLSDSQFNELFRKRMKTVTYILTADKRSEMRVTPSDFTQLMTDAAQSVLDSLSAEERRLTHLDGFLRLTALAARQNPSFAGLTAGKQVYVLDALKKSFLRQWGVDHGFQESFKEMLQPGDIRLGLQAAATRNTELLWRFSTRRTRIQVASAETSLALPTDYASKPLDIYRSEAPFHFLMLQDRSHPDNYLLFQVSGGNLFIRHASETEFRQLAKQASVRLADDPSFRIFDGQIAASERVLTASPKTDSPFSGKMFASFTVNAKLTEPSQIRVRRPSGKIYRDYQSAEMVYEDIRVPGQPQQVLRFLSYPGIDSSFTIDGVTVEGLRGGQPFSQPLLIARIPGDSGRKSVYINRILDMIRSGELARLYSAEGLEEVEFNIDAALIKILRFEAPHYETSTGAARTLKNYRVWVDETNAVVPYRLIPDGDIVGEPPALRSEMRVFQEEFRARLEKLSEFVMDPAKTQGDAEWWADLEWWVSFYDSASAAFENLHQPENTRLLASVIGASEAIFGYYNQLLQTKSEKGAYGDPDRGKKISLEKPIPTSLLDKLLKARKLAPTDRFGDSFFLEKVRRKAFPVQEAREILLDMTARAYRILAALENDERKGDVPREYSEDFDALNIRNSREILASHLMMRERESGFHFWPEFIYWGAPADAAQEQGVAVYPHNFLTIREGGAEPDSTPERFSGVMTSVLAPVKSISTILTGKVNMLPSLEAETAAAEPQFRFRRFLVLKKPLPRFPEQNELTAAFLEEYFVSDPYEIAALFELGEDSTPERRREVLERVREFTGQGRLLFQDYYSIFEKDRISQYANFVARASGRPEESRALEVSMRRYFDMQSRELPEMMQRTGLHSKDTAEDNYRIWQVMDAALSIAGGEKKHHQRMGTVMHSPLISEALLPGAEAQIPRSLFVLWGAGRAKDNSWLIPHSRPSKVAGSGFRKIMGATPVKRAGEGADVRHESWDRTGEKFNKMEANLKRRKFREAFEAASAALSPELRKLFEAQVSYAVMKVMGLPGEDTKPREFAAGIYDGLERERRSADYAFSPLALSLRPEILLNVRKNYDMEWTAILESFKAAGREDASAALSAHILEMARYRYALTASGLPSFDLANMPVFDFNSVKSQADWQRYLFDPVLAQIREGGIPGAIARREEFARAEAEKYGLILEIHQALREKNFRALFGKMKELIARAKREGLAFMPAIALRGFERDLEDLKVVFTDQLITSLGRFEGRSQEAVPMIMEGIDILGEVPESLREVAGELGLTLPETQAPAPVVQAVAQPTVTGVQPLTAAVVTTAAVPEVTVALPQTGTEVSLPFSERLEKITSWIDRPAEAEARSAEEWRRDAEWFFSLYSDEAARAGLSEAEKKALQYAEGFMVHFYKQAWNAEKKGSGPRDVKSATLLRQVRGRQLSGVQLRDSLLDYAAQVQRILAAMREDDLQGGAFTVPDYPELSDEPAAQRLKLRNFLIALEERESGATPDAPERSKPAFFFYPRFEALGVDPGEIQNPEGIFELYKILILRFAGLEARYTPTGLAITLMDAENPVIAVSVAEGLGPFQPPYLVAVKDARDPNKRFFRMFILKKPLPDFPERDEMTREFIDEYFVTNRDELMEYGIPLNDSIQRRNQGVNKLVAAAREGRVIAQGSYLLYSREGADKWSAFMARSAQEERALRLAMLRRLRMHQAEMPAYYMRPSAAKELESYPDVVSAWRLVTEVLGLETGASRPDETRRGMAIWAEETFRQALLDEKNFFVPLAALLGATETVTIPARGDQGPQLQRRLLFEAREGSVFVQKFRSFYNEALKNNFFEKWEQARSGLAEDLKPLFDFQVLDGILQLITTGQTLKNRVAMTGLAQRIWKTDTVNLAPAALYVRVMKDSETRLWQDLNNRWHQLVENLLAPRGENRQAKVLALAEEISAIDFYLSNGFEKVQDTELTRFSSNPSQWDRAFSMIKEKISAPKYRSALDSRARAMADLDAEHRQVAAIRQAYEERDDEAFFTRLAAFRASVEVVAGRSEAVPEDLVSVLDAWRDFLAADFVVRLSSEVEARLDSDDFQGARALVDRAERILGAGVETESLSQIRQGILDSEREARGATWGMVWTKLAEPLDVSPESDMAAAAGRMGTEEAARAREVMAARKTAEKPDATALELTRVLDQASVWKSAEGGYAESITSFEEHVRTKLATVALSEADALESAENFAGVLALVDAVAPRLADPQPLVQIRDALRQRGQDAWKNFEEGLDRPLDQLQAESMARNLTLARKIRAAFGVTDETSPEAADMALEYRRIAESAGENEAGVRDLADVLAGLNEMLERRSEMRVDTARLETLKGLVSARLETSVRAVVLAKTSDPRVTKRDYSSAFRLIAEVRSKAGEMPWLVTLRAETEKQGIDAENLLWAALVSPLNQPQSAALAKNFELFEAVRKGSSGTAPEDFYYTLIGFREEAEDNAVTFERLVEMRDQVRALGSVVTRTERESFEKLLDARAELKASKTIKSLREDRKYKKAREAMSAALAKLGGARPAIDAESFEMTTDWNALGKTFWETVGLPLDQKLAANAETALLRARKLEEEFPQTFRHGDAYSTVLEVRKAVEAGPGSSVQGWIRLLNNLEAVRGQIASEPDSFNKFFKLLEAKVAALVTYEVQPALDRDDAQEAERIFQMYTRMFSREPEVFGVLREKITAKKQLNARAVMTEKLAALHAEIESAQSRTPEEWMEIVNALKGLEARLFDDMRESWSADLARAEEKAGTGAKKEVNKLLIQNLYEAANARMTVLTGVLGAGADFFEKQKQALRIARKDAVGEFWGGFSRSIEAGNSAADDMRAALSRHRTLSVILGETPELEDASKWLDYRQKAEAAASLPPPVMGVEDENNPYKAILGLLEEAAPDLQSDHERVSSAVRGYRIALARLFLRRAKAEILQIDDPEFLFESLGALADFASQFGIDENDLSDEGMGTFFLNPLPAAEKLEYYFLMAEMFTRTDNAENGQHFLTTQREAFRDFPAQQLALDRRIIELENQIEWTDDVPVRGVEKVLRTVAEKREKKISDLAEKYRQADSRDNTIDRDFYGEWLEALAPEHEIVAQWHARRSEMRTRPHHSASRSPHEIFSPEQAAEIEALDDKSLIVPLRDISNEASLMFRVPGKRGVYLLKKPNLSTSGAQDSLANEAAIMREIQADVKEHSADSRHVFSPHRNLRIGVWNYNLNGLVLPYLDGENADDFFIESGRKLEPLQFLKVALAMTDVVGYLHTLQIVHRDIKPKNFFITRDGHIVLIDLNFAYSKRIQRNVIWGGTRGFTSKQQWEGQTPEYNHDVYAMGRTLLEIWLGRLNDEEKPTGISTGKLVQDIDMREHFDFKNCPIEDIIRKAMDPEPGKRYENVQVMYEAILHRLSVIRKRSEVRERGEEARDPQLLEQFGDKYDKKTILEVEGENIGTYPDEELVGKLAGGEHVFRVYVSGAAQPRNIIKVGHDLRSSRYILKEAVRLTQFAQKGIKGIPVLKRIGKMTDGNLWIELEGVAWAVSLSDYAFSGPAEVFDAILKIVDPLARVHKAGYSHNDIKAANILRNSVGETQLNDFAFAERSNRENIKSGTLGYIPLTEDYKQIEGRRGPDADVYALILTLASLLEDYEDEEIAALRDSYLKLIFKKYKFSSMASLIKKVNAMRGGGEAPFVQRPRNKWPSLQELTLRMTQDLTKLRSEMRVFSPSEVSVIRQRGSLLEQAFPVLSEEARQALLFPSLFTVFLGIKPLYLRYSDEKGPDSTVLSNEFRQVPAVWEQMALYFHPHRMYAPAFAVTALSRNDGLLRRTGVLTDEDNPELRDIVRAYSVNFPLFLNLGVRLMERLLQKFPDNSEQGAALRGALLGIPGEYVDFYLQMLRLSGQGDLARVARESARVRTEFPDIKLVVPVGEAENQHPYLERMIDTVYYGYSIVRNMPGFREAAEAIGLPEEVFHQEPVFLRRSEIRPSKSEDQDILRETVTGSRSIDMVFDSQTFGLIHSGVQARLRRMAAEYPKNWQAGDYDRRVGIVEDKRAVAVSLPSPVTVDGETYDQAEISGVLFTEENLGQPFTGYSAGGEARKATAQESAEAIDVEFGSDGRVRLTPKKFPQYGGHGSETADKKFYNARTLLPSMGVRSSLVAGYGKYRDEKLRHLGVFITLSKSAAGMRFEGTLQAVEDDFSQALSREVRRVKTGVRIWTAEDPTGEKEIFNRVMDMPYGGEGYGGRTYRQIFTRAMEKYGEELWSVIAKGLYPNSPHFGNFEMDILGDAPALWHDLGGWKRRQQDRLSDAQAFAYAYWTLHYAITVIHRDRLGRLHDAGLFNPYEIFLRAFFRSQAANPDFRPADLSFNHQGRSNLDAAILDIKYLKQAHKYPPLFEQTDAPFVKVLRAAMGFAPAVKAEAAASETTEAEALSAGKSADEMTAERLHARFYARIHRLAQPFFYPGLIVRWLGIARGEDGEAKLEQAVIQYEKDQARRLTFADEQAGLHAVLDEVRQAVLAARSEMRGGAAKERTDDLVTRFVPGARAIDMTFDSERLAQVSESVQARIGRIASEYRKDWLPGDANAESGFSEVKRAVKIDLEKPVMVDGELYDQVEISGVLFTPENLNKPFRNKSVMGTGKSVEELGEETIREDAVDVGVDPDGRFNLTPEKPAQEGGHGADTAENKFHNARTTLPKRGLKGPAVLGFGRYRDSSLSIAGNRLGVFVSFTRKNGRQRFGEYFRARMMAFSQELTAALRRAEQVAQAQSLLLGVRVAPNEGAIVRRIEAKYGFQQLIQRYGEELGGLVEQGIYPNTPHFNNMEIDFEGTDPVIWYDLGGWKLRENLTPLQAFGYAYWTLDFGVMVVSRDTALLRILRSRGFLDWSPHEAFLRGFFKAQQESGVFEPGELEVNTEGISNLDAIILREENRASSPDRLSLPPMAEQRDKPFVPVLRIKVGMDSDPAAVITEARAIYDELASSVPRPAAGFFYPKLIEKWINLAEQEDGINLLNQEVNGFLNMVQKRLYPGQYDDFKTVIDETRRRIAALRSEMRAPEKDVPRPALRGWEQTRIFIPEGERLFVGNRYIVHVDAVSYASREKREMVRLGVNVPQSAWVRSEEKFNETRVSDVLAHRRGEGPSFAERSLDPALVYLSLHRFNDQAIVAGSGRTKTGVLENDLEMRLTVSRIFRGGRQFGVELLVETPSGVQIQKELPQISGWERARVFLPAGERLLIAGKYILRVGNVFYGDRERQMIASIDFNVPLNGWALTEERYVGTPLRNSMGRGTSFAGIPFDQRVADPSIKYLTLHRFPGQMIFLGDAMRKTGALDQDLDARILVAESIAGDQGGVELQVDVPAGAALELESEPLSGGESRSEMRLNASDLLPSSWPFGNPLSPAPSVYALDDEHVVDNDTSLAIMRAVLQAAARQHREILGFPEGSELSVEGLKQGAFSQIIRILVDDKPSNTILEIPASLDGKAETIASNARNFSYYRSLGRRRFTPRPYSLYYIPLNYRGARFDAPAAIHEYLDGYEELNFGYGTLRRWDASLPGNPFIDIPRAEVPQVLAEIMAAISYHYEPDLDGGTSPVDFYINNGDFVYRKQADGSHDVKIITMRRRQSGISIPNFILSLVQFYSTEDIETDANKVSEDHALFSIQAPVPVLVSNPGIAFHGILRGREYLYKDLGFQDYKTRAANEVHSWLRQFAASKEGRRYRSWVEDFLNDRLPLTFGEDPAEGRPARHFLEDIREELIEGRGHHQPSDSAYAELERKITLINERIPDAFEISNAEAAVIPFSADEVGQMFAAKNLLASEPVQRGEQAEKIAARLRQVTDRRFSPADINSALAAAELGGVEQNVREALASELNSKFVFARSEMRAIPQETAASFFDKLGEIYTIFSRNQTDFTGHSVDEVISGLLKRDFTDILNLNRQTAKETEIRLWADRMWREYSEILPHLRVAVLHSDLLFNQAGDAIVFSGSSVSGKSSLAHALAKISSGSINHGAQDDTLFFYIPGYLYAGSDYLQTRFRARAYQGERRFGVKQDFRMGPVRTVVEIDAISPENRFKKDRLFSYAADGLADFSNSDLEIPVNVIYLTQSWSQPSEYESYAAFLLPRVIPQKKSEMREVSEARANEFAGAVSGLLEILNRPEYKDYSYLTHIILAGLRSRNFSVVRGQNGKLAAEVTAWAGRVTSEFPDIVPFMSTASRFGDLLFNSEGEAILVFGKSEAGKGSIGYALSRVSQDRIRVASQDNINLIRIPGYLLAVAGTSRKTIRARAYDSHNELSYETRPGVGLVKAEIRMESVKYKPEEFEGSSLAADMDALFPDYKGQRLASWKVMKVRELMVDAGDYDKFAPGILPELEGPRSEMRAKITSEKTVWAARAASESSQLAVARDITARILGLNVMRRLYNVLFPKISKDASAAMAAPARAALAADYTQLFRSGGSTVLPVSLLERLSPEAREVYLEIIYEGFRKSGQAPRPFIYFAGSSSETVKMQISGRGFFRNHPGSQDLFRFSRQSEYTEAVWHKKQDISVALSGIAENETVEYRIPAFLLGADEIKQLDDPAFFKYVHQLTELQLLAASELKHALKEAVDAKQMAAVTGDFLHRAGVHDFKTGASGFLMPSPGSLLAADLTRYIQTRALTEAAA